jgi:hypothetical protein
MSVNGCSEKNTTNKSTNEVQQTIGENTNSDEEDASSTSNKNEELQDYFMQKGKILLIGKINNKLDIHMELQITNKDHFDDIGEMYWNPTATMIGEKPVTLYEGYYYYDQYMKHIRIEAEAYSNSYFSIYEFDENNNYNGSFGGFIESGNILKGTWNNDKGTTYEFYLIKSTSKIDETNLNFDTNKIGDYYAIGSNKNNYIHLYIVATSDDKFKFHISGYSKPNVGNIGGVAYYTDKSKGEAALYDKEDNLKIDFKFNDKTIKVSITGSNNYAGAHVRMDGTFEKSKSKINFAE